jgi:hypothetical protein
MRRRISLLEVISIVGVPARRGSVTRKLLRGRRGVRGGGRRGGRFRGLRGGALLHLVQADESVERALPRRRDVVIVRAFLVVLAQRVPDPVVRQQDTAEIRVPLELHAEEVELLSLEPVGRLPDRLDARYCRRARSSCVFKTKTWRSGYEKRW